LEPGAPLHDQHSHNADAFRYAAMAEPQMSNDSFENKPISYPAFTVA